MFVPPWLEDPTFQDAEAGIAFESSPPEQSAARNDENSPPWMRAAAAERLDSPPPGSLGGSPQPGTRSPHTPERHGLAERLRMCGVVQPPGPVKAAVQAPRPHPDSAVRRELEACTAGGITFDARGVEVLVDPALLTDADPELGSLAATRCGRGASPTAVRSPDKARWCWGAPCARPSGPKCLRGWWMRRLGWPRPGASPPTVCTPWRAGWTASLRGSLRRLLPSSSCAASVQTRAVPGDSRCVAGPTLVLAVPHLSASADSQPHATCRARRRQEGAGAHGVPRVWSMANGSTPIARGCPRRLTAAAHRLSIRRAGSLTSNCGR